MVSRISPTPAPFAPTKTNRGHGRTTYRVVQRPPLLVDHDCLERLRNGHAVRLRRLTHVLRDQADHVAAERQKRQDRERHLESRLHRAASRRCLGRGVRPTLQGHGVWALPQLEVRRRHRCHRRCIPSSWVICKRQ